MKRTKRILSVLLAAYMLLTLFPPGALATELGGDVVITALEPPIESDSSITVQTGTEESAVLAQLPGELSATVERTDYETHLDGTAFADGQLAPADAIPAQPAENTITETQSLAVSWESDKTFTSESAGVFTYAAKLVDEGYSLMEGLSMPQITVTVEQADPSTPAEEPHSGEPVPPPDTSNALGETGELTVDGGTLGVDYSYMDHTLTILTGTPLTISGTSNADRIVVATRVNADLSLNGTSIDVSEKEENALDITSYASLTLSLQGENFLTGGKDRAGIHVPYQASLTIQGEGKLTVRGGKIGDGGGAGIGANKGERCGSITICGGLVDTMATGQGGAGIGQGGWWRAEGTLSITGGYVISVGAGDEGAFSVRTLSITGGIVFQQDIGAVYGDVVLTESVSLPAGKRLSIPQNGTLTVAAGTSLGSSGVILNYGTLKNAGIITNTGTIHNNGILSIGEHGAVTNGGLFTNSGEVTGSGTFQSNGTIYNIGMLGPTIGGSIINPMDSPYIGADGNTYAIPANYTLITSDMTEWNSQGDNAGWYLAFGGLEFPSRITVNGDVHLILMDSSDLIMNGGITVAAGSSLTFYAQSTDDNMGRLTAQNMSRYDAGIGGESWGTCGSVTINGGYISSHGAIYGSGIGAAYEDGSGIVTINGGKVLASSQDGSGIGGVKAPGCKVNINGGTLMAAGGRTGGGISGCTTIIGGTIEANGTGGGAGILGNANGTLIISEGYITASSTEGAGIGGDCRITISGGTITARGRAGGIICKSGEISGGTVQALADPAGADGVKGLSDTPIDGSNGGNGIENLIISGSAYVIAKGNNGGQGSRGWPNGGRGGNGGFGLYHCTVLGGLIQAEGGVGGAGGGGIGGAQAGWGGADGSPITGSIIEGGSIKVSGSVSLKNAKQEDLWPGVLAVSGVTDISVDGTPYYISRNYMEDGNLYLYMTGKDHRITAYTGTGNQAYKAQWNAESKSFTVTSDGTIAPPVQNASVVLNQRSYKSSYGETALPLIVTVETLNASNLISPFTVSKDAVQITITSDRDSKPVFSESKGAEAQPGKFSFSLDISALAVGTYTIHAEYGGSATLLGSNAAEAELTVVKASQAPPEAPPTARQQTADSITLNAISGSGGKTVEYGYSTAEDTAPGLWQTNTVFTDLTAATAYTFYSRYAENDCYIASPASSVGSTVYTAAATPRGSDVTISYTDEVITFADTLEVHTREDFYYGDLISSGSPIQKYMGQSLYARVKRAGDIPASAAMTVNIPTRPATPSFRIDTKTESVTIPVGYDYDMDRSGNWIHGDGSAVTVPPQKDTLIRKAATDKDFKSNNQWIYVSRGGYPPNVSIDYSNERLSTVTSWEYKLDGDTDWKVCAENMDAHAFGWDGGAALNISFRVSATPYDYASDASLVCIPARTGAPTGLQGVNETVAGRNNGQITGVTTDMQYKLSTAKSWRDCTAASITGLASGIYQVRVKATDSAFASVGTEIVIADGIAPTYTLNITAPVFASVNYGYDQPDAKVITISSTGNSNATISGVALSGTGAERFTLNKTDGTTILAGHTDSATYTVRPVGGLAVGTYTATITVTYDNSATATDTVTFTVKRAAQAAPTAPTLDKKTYNSVSLKEIVPNGNAAAAQYSRDGGETWQDSREFTGLASGTAYTFTARYAETANYEASPSSEPLSVTTDTPSSSGGSTHNKPSVRVEGVGGKVSIGNGTVTILPDDGYQIGKVTVNGKEVKVPESGKLTGLKRTDKVVVAFEKIQADAPDVLASFTDLNPGAWYSDAVRYVVEHDLFTGTSAATFSPDATMTRAMLVTVLYRTAGEPDMTDKVLGYPFADVDAESWYGTAVYWARLNGIASGTGEETFSPDGPITREQLAVMLWRYAGSPTTTSEELNFTDVSEAGSYAMEALRWAVGQGIISGNGGSILAPKSEATRAEVAAMLYRFITIN